MMHIQFANNEEEATIMTGPWRLPTVYKYDVKGKVRMWSIGFTGSVLISESGIDGGKLTRNTSNVKLTTRSKNISHQAYIVANGKYTKKVKEGMMTKDTISRVEPGNYNLPRGKIAMLAQHYDEGRIVDGEKQFSVQPKFDGLRCRARLTEKSQMTKVSLVKRGGDRIPYCKLLRRQIYFLLKRLPQGWQLDGELYNHNMSLQQIEGIVGRSVNRHQNENKLMFYIFDLIPPNVNTPNSTYIERRQMLMGMFQSLSDLNPKIYGLIRLARDHICTRMDEVETIHDKFVELGYEGAIIKLWDRNYVTSKGFHIMKYVKFKSIEATIIGFDKANGTEDGAILFKIRLKNGLEQGVRPTGTIEKRRKMYLEGDQYIGRECTIRFKDFTPANKLHAPVLFRII